MMQKQSKAKATNGVDIRNEEDTEDESISSIQQTVSKMTIPVHISAEVIYSGVFLDEVAQERIREYICSVSGNDLLDSLTDCHLTLSWNPDSGHVDALPFGSKVQLKAIGICSDSYVQS